MKKILLFGLILILSLLFTSCVMQRKSKKSWKLVKPAKKSFVHVVKWQEETLPLISSWYTGNKNNAGRLAKANPNINPDKIVIGDNIYIPDSLLDRMQEMPRKFVRLYSHRPKKKKSAYKRAHRPASQPVVKKEKKEATQDEFILFGPK